MAVITTFAFDLDGNAMASELVEQIRMERQRNRRPEIDVAHVATGKIPVGTDANIAKKTLEDNGFKVVRRDLPDGSYRLTGSRFEKSIPPILNDEYRIVLTIEQGRVASVFARIWLQAP